MDKRGTRLVAAAVVLSGLLAGCGGPSGDEHLPPTGDSVAWAGRLCSALQPLGALRGSSPNFDRNNPTESRQAMSQYFGQAQAAADESLRGLGEAGPSPIPGGDDVANKLRNSLVQLQAAYGHAKTKVESVDPGDPVGLGSQLPGILTELDTATDNASLRQIGTNEALNDAVSKAPSCSLVGQGAPAGN
jgi:hypothetical protein